MMAALAIPPTEPGFARHMPVLLSESLGALSLKPGGVYVDGTFGAGGYTREILSAFPDIRVFAFDRDPDAIEGGSDLVQAANGRLTLIADAFSAMADHDLPPVDGVVLDIGISSMQVDESERGFSFRNDGPLDMRMEQAGPSAADLLNSESEERLADIFYHYGEERLSRPLARAIVADRQAKPFRTTRQLAELCGRIIHHKFGEIHPATRAFQALRIAVNDELGELARALHAAERILKPGGMLVVVTFHSLEDRIVKQFFAARSGRGGGSRHRPLEAPTSSFTLPGRWPVTPGADEVAFNPRARSAKLRAGVRNASPALPEDAQVMSLASLPDAPRNRSGRRG
ncbi:MAG: 16S rRNA (cytosine(1402)-N(4))-methyltransferase RsmH [Beijerinckiaceae bacterium]